MTGESPAEAAPVSEAVDVRQLLFKKYNGFVSISAMSAFMAITNTMSVGYLPDNGNTPSGAGVAETSNRAGSYTFSYYMDPNTQELHVCRITFNALADSSDDTFIAAASFLAELSALGIIPASSSEDFRSAISQILSAADANRSVTINGVKIYFATAPVDDKILVFASAEGFDF